MASSIHVYREKLEFTYTLARGTGPARRYRPPADALVRARRYPASDAAARGPGDAPAGRRPGPLTSVDDLSRHARHRHMCTLILSYGYITAILTPATRAMLIKPDTTP